MDRRNVLLYWWPAVARYAGGAIGAYGVLIASSADKSAVLAFAGALIVAPNIADAQRKRNRERALEEER